MSVAKLSREGFGSVKAVNFCDQLNNCKLKTGCIVE
jgi:hypothetical protein